MMDRTTITIPVLILIFSDHVVSSVTEWYQTYPNRSLAVVTAASWALCQTACCVECFSTGGCKAAEFSAGNGACRLSDRDSVHANPSDMVVSTASNVFVQGSVAFPPCPLGWTQWDQFCYFYIADSETHITAELLCRELSANLVYIDSLEEHNFVWQSFGGVGGIWIGLAVPFNGVPPLVWTNAQAVTYENYHAYEPSGGIPLMCVKIEIRWLSEACANIRPSVCKMPEQ